MRGAPTRVHESKISKEHLPGRVEVFLYVLLLSPLVLAGTSGKKNALAHLLFEHHTPDLLAVGERNRPRVHSSFEIVVCHPPPISPTGPPPPSPAHRCMHAGVGRAS